MTVKAPQAFHSEGLTMADYYVATHAEIDIEATLIRAMQRSEVDADGFEATEVAVCIEALRLVDSLVSEGRLEAFKADVSERISFANKSLRDEFAVPQMPAVTPTDLDEQLDNYFRGRACNDPTISQGFLEMEGFLDSLPSLYAALPVLRSLARVPRPNNRPRGRVPWEYIDEELKEIRGLIASGKKIGLARQMVAETTQNMSGSPENKVRTLRKLYKDKMKLREG